MIAELGLAIKHRIPLRKIADTLHAYPTLALGNRRAADQWYIQNAAPWVIRVLKIDPRLSRFGSAAARSECNRLIVQPQVRLAKLPEGSQNIGRTRSPTVVLAHQAVAHFTLSINHKRRRVGRLSGASQRRP